VAQCNPDVIYLHNVPRIAMYTPFLGRVRIVRMIHDMHLCCPRGYGYFVLSGKICHHKAGWRCWLDAAFLVRNPHHPRRFQLAGIGAKLREMRAHHALDAVLVGSRFMREKLLQNGFTPDRIHILHPIVPEAGLAAAPVPEEPRVLYVGSLLRGKGVDLLLEALHQVPCPFTASIVGVGKSEAALKQQCARLGLEDRVKFAGWQENQRLGVLYQEAKVVAVPSRGPEAFGMVGIEAMRHGRPVVAFDVGGIPDWLDDGETGYRVPEQDTAAFALALESILTDTALARQLGDRARVVARERFAFEDYIARLERALAGKP
jgi:glycosyltransferase involved in cell wall biosynthesis